jgi:epoxyqueuosine reductase
MVVKPEERDALRSELKKRAQELGFDDVGFCTAAPFDEWSKNAYDALKRRLTSDPKTVMPEAKSIVVAVRRYAVYGKFPEGSAAVANYYVSSEEAYENVKPLAELIRSFGYSAVADPPIPEKQAALRTGLGTQGLNTQFCHHEFGNLVSLHSVLTDAPLAESDSPRTQCSGCGLCVSACPTGALHDGIFGRERCLRYHMISGNPVPVWARGLMGTRLLGCIECQHACPKARKTVEEVPQELAWACDIAGLLSGDKARYDKLAGYIGTNFARKKRILAQAAICAGNSGSKAYVPGLAALLCDDNTVVRSHAAWALGILGGPEALGALGKALTAEADESVRTEIAEALKSQNK